MIIAKFAIAAAVGYTLGSIPFGFLVVKKMTGIDIRKRGSNKLGTTNVLRVAGRKAAAIVFSLDLLKGSLAVIIAGLIFGRDYMVLGDFALGMLVAQVIAAVAAMLGHSWSMFLKFRGGGRGVATFFGGMAALFPPAALIGGEIFIIGAGVTRYASFASIVAAISTYFVLMPLIIINKFPIEYLIYALIGTIVILIMHRGNISRLLAGKERKIGEKA